MNYNNLTDEVSNIHGPIVMNNLRWSISSFGLLLFSFWERHVYSVVLTTIMRRCRVYSVHCVSQLAKTEIWVFRLTPLQRSRLRNTAQPGHATVFNLMRTNPAVSSTSMAGSWSPRTSLRRSDGAGCTECQSRRSNGGGKWGFACSFDPAWLAGLEVRDGGRGGASPLCHYQIGGASPSTAPLFLPFLCSSHLALGVFSRRYERLFYIPRNETITSASRIISKD
jgi:hypothetical protein